MNRMSFTASDERAFHVRRDELVADYGAWLEQLPVTVELEDFGMLLMHKWEYGDGRLDLWKRTDLSTFLLNWCPRHLTASAEQAHGVPSAVALGMSFLASAGLLAKGSDPVDRLVEHAMGLQETFEEKVADPTQFGMAKSVFSSLGIEDPTALSPEQLEAAVAGFNALPMDQRLAVTDPAIAGRDAARQSQIGPIVMPDADAVLASAEASPVLAQFEALAAYLAPPGRTLTARGNLKIADARALAELMHTSDVYEQQHGDRVYRKHTAVHFTELDHWQWWARECGAIRKVGNRLVGVKAWQQRRAKDSVQEVRRAFETLITFGPVSAYWPRGLTDMASLMDDAVGPLLGRLVDVGGPDTYEELEETWLTIVPRAGRSEPYSGAAGRSLNMLLTILERCGILSQADVGETPGRYGDSVRSGGTVDLTSVGTVLAVELIREQGVIVDVLPPMADLSVDELVQFFRHHRPAGLVAHDRPMAG